MRETVTMENETAMHLWALRKVNEALVVGLNTAIFAMEQWDDLTPERRRSMIESLKGLVASKEAYGTEGQTH